jgi:DNA-binding LacI/PurR family transcriptional regulator
MKLEDVARRAKVSTATVSRVLNNTDLVKPATRARVLKAVQELNYSPNLHARTLAGGSSRTLGVIVSNLENPFFLDVFRAFERDARNRGYEVMVANTDYRSQRLVSSVRLMVGRRVEGLALIVSEMDTALIDELAASRIPVVCYDVGVPRLNITNIRVNYRTGMQRVVEYLHDLGHRRIGFIGHHTTLAPLSVRKESFLEAVARHTPRIEFRTIADADGLLGGRQAARQLLDSGFRPTAIICVNDFMALGVLRELRERDLAVPRDVSVTGFDNISLSEFVYPPLTTVQIPRDRIGHLMLERLVPPPGATPDRDVIIDPEFIVRESTGPVSAD